MNLPFEVILNIRLLHEIFINLISFFYNMFSCLAIPLRTYSLRFAVINKEKLIMVGALICMFYVVILIGTST